MLTKLNSEMFEKLQKLIVLHRNYQFLQNSHDFLWWNTLTILFLWTQTHHKKHFCRMSRNFNLINSLFRGNSKNIEVPRNTSHYLQAWLPVSSSFMAWFEHQKFLESLLAEIIGLRPVKDESFGLETKGTEVPVLYKIFKVVSSRIKIFQTVSSRPCLVCFNCIQSRLGLVLIWMSSF